jgi:hypothetical protein
MKTNMIFQGDALRTLLNSSKKIEKMGGEK